MNGDTFEKLIPYLKRGFSNRALGAIYAPDALRVVFDTNKIGSVSGGVLIFRESNLIAGMSLESALGYVMEGMSAEIKEREVEFLLATKDFVEIYTSYNNVSIENPEENIDFRDYFRDVWNMYVGINEFKRLSDVFNKYADKKE